jgi:CHAT domain-containing protein/Tfp pilus assembly protein PilF
LAAILIAGLPLIIAAQQLPSKAEPPGGANMQSAGDRASSGKPPSQQNESNQPQEVTTLELGKPIEREISGGQKHLYQIPLSEGQHMTVVLRKMDVNVSVRLRLPGGEIHSLLDGYLATSPDFESRWVGETTGMHQYEISGRPKALSGRYEIRITELRPATETDRELQRARNIFAEGFRLHRQGKYLEARPLMLRALEIRERIFGPDSPLLASTLGPLATNYDSTGDYARGQTIRVRELKILEQALGPNHPAVASVIFQIGITYLGKGDDLKAEELYLKALGIFETANQADTNEVAWLLGALGNIYYDRDDFKTAEKYYQQSRVVLERIFGPDHYHLADSYKFLGRVAYDAGDYAKAQAMFQRALTLIEKGVGQDHPMATGYRNDLATVYVTTTDYAKAETLYRQSLSVHEQKGAMSKPVVQETLLGLARLYAARGMSSEAAKLQTQASELEERYVRLNLAVGSEREKLALLNRMSLGSSRHISLHGDLAPNDLTARDLAVTTILRRKGRVQDVMSDTLAALRQRFGADDQKLLDQFDDITARLAKLILNGPQKMTAAEHQQQVKAVEQEREGLEAEISRRSSGYYERALPVTLAAVRGSIPPQAALIEFALYRPFDPKKPDNRTAYGDPHYVAYVIRRDGEVQWKELGETKSVDAAIEAWRKALRDPARRDVRQLARAVDEKVMRPVRALAGEAKQLLISPDGALNLIPFAALLDEQGHYLVEGYSLTYLTSGRDLLRMQVARESRSRPVVVADPAFGEPPVIASSGAGARLQIDYSRLFFGPLPGVADEVRALRELLPDAAFLTKDQATKAALKNVRAPSILHIATHGFFLSEPETLPSAAQRQGRTRGIKADSKIRNPLLRSGLALAGANRINDGDDDDGVLTALEMAHLDLWGTKLVVLSACDTGVGEVKNDDGVYGLRRALVLAGAESQLVSLWPVSDRSTRDLMIEYYKGLTQDQGRSEALRQVQLRMLRGKSHSHPYYWASFIQTGEWANVKGKR